MVPIFGGRRWTAISTASLLIPALWMGFAVQNPDTPFMIFAIIALLCGFGGGNFASSMSNISFFYPKSEQGTALGLNAGLGNLGVSVMQFLVPVIILFAVFGSLGGDAQIAESGKHFYLQNAGFIWVPFIILFSVLAWFGMNDIATAKASFKDQSIIFKRKHNWIMCILYMATFGSFIGFSAAFPMLIKNSFPMIDALKFAFLGPLVGALFRPVGGRPKSVLAMNTTTSPENEIESIQLSEIPPPASTNDAGFTAIAVNPTSNNDPNLDNENNELIVALTSLICTALSLRKQKQQEHQLILFEERATIARELHDSLAQSLSYLKIQISVLERNLKNGCNDHIEIIVRQHIAQIKQGLNSAYQQLRDLLITFRLTIDNDNFEQALHEAAKEFADKGRFDIELNNRIMTLNLSATEQINLIQIAREALSNITRHAQAKNVEINLAFDDEDKHIVMSISDDGVGMPDTVDQTQHHGLMIMKERAHNLNGELSLAHYEPHGTIVTIKFVPNFFEEDKD